MVTVTVPAAAVPAPDRAVAPGSPSSPPFPAASRRRHGAVSAIAPPSSSRCPRRPRTRCSTRPRPGRRGWPDQRHHGGRDLTVPPMQRSTVLAFVGFSAGPVPVVGLRCSWSVRLLLGRPSSGRRAVAVRAAARPPRAPAVAFRSSGRSALPLPAEAAACPSPDPPAAAGPPLAGRRAGPSSRSRLMLAVSPPVRCGHCPEHHCRCPTSSAHSTLAVCRPLSAAPPGPYVARPSAVPPARRVLAVPAAGLPPRAMRPARTAASERGALLALVRRRAGCHVRPCYRGLPPTPLRRAPSGPLLLPRGRCCYYGNQRLARSDEGQAWDIAG